MKRMIQGRSALLFVAVLATTSVAHAQATPRQEARQMDANIDGVVSADEHEAGVEMTFDAVDADEDNFISADEMDAAREAKNERGTQSSADRIAALDLDKDGRLSETEHAAGAKATFKEADASSDGNLDPDEIKAADEKAKAAMPTP